VIRPARVSDIPSLSRIEREATAAFDAPIRAHARTFPPLPDDAFASSVEASTAWVAADPDDRPVGFIACGFPDAIPFVKELSVLTTHHRRGLGSALLARAAEWASPWAALTLTTFRDVPFNAPFYARRGFAMFEPDKKAWPALAARLAAERSAWSGAADRVAMIRRL
jgi:GNAT superfamily N-acetyltransferase